MGLRCLKNSPGQSCQDPIFQEVQLRQRENQFALSLPVAIAHGSSLSCCRRDDVEGGEAKARAR